MNIQPKPPKIKLVWNGYSRGYFAVVPTELHTNKTMGLLDLYLYKVSRWHRRTYAHIQ